MLTAVASQLTRLCALAEDGHLIVDHLQEPAVTAKPCARGRG
jgi:hypothetical protein